MSKFKVGDCVVKNANTATRNGASWLMGYNLLPPVGTVGKIIQTFECSSLNIVRVKWNEKVHSSYDWSYDISYIDVVGGEEF